MNWWDFPDLILSFFARVFLLHESSQIWADNIFLLNKILCAFLRLHPCALMFVYPMCWFGPAVTRGVLERNTKSATNHLIGSGYLKMRPMIGWYSPFCNDLKCERAHCCSQCCWFYAAVCHTTENRFLALWPKIAASDLNLSIITLQINFMRCWNILNTLCAYAKLQ